MPISGWQKFRGHTDFSHVIVQDAKLSFTNARFERGSQTVLRFMTLQGTTVLDFSTAWFLGGDVELRNMLYDNSCRFKFIHPQALRKVPRTDWEEADPGDLPTQLEPHAWPPMQFVPPAQSGP